MTGTTGACLHGGGLALVTDDVVSDARSLAPLSATLFGRAAGPLDQVFISFDARKELKVTPKAERLVPPFAELLRDRALPSLTFKGHYRTAPAEPDDRETQIAALGAAFDRGPTPYSRPEGTMPSAFVYFGQFLAHEVSRLHQVSATGYENLRTASLDLDTVLWPDPTGPQDIQADLDRVQAMRRDGMALGRTSEPTADRFADIPRSFLGAPRVPDGRCDANLALAQLYVAILRHYVNLLERHCTDARHRLLAEIHEITLYDFLPRIIDSDLYDDVMANGRRLVMPGNGDPGSFQIPIEFAAAAFRFGHTLVRPSYRWSRFDPLGEVPQSALQQSTCAGGGLDTHPVDRHRGLDTVWEADWADMSGPNARNLAPLISASLAPQLTELPAVHVEGATRPVNLAQLSLDRGRTLQLPSAQGFRAAYQGLFPDFLHERQLFDNLPEPMVLALCDAASGERLVDRTPLWFYVIREAEVLGCGAHLGPIGGRLVMETLHAAIAAAVGGPPPQAHAHPCTLHDLLTDLCPLTPA